MVTEELVNSSISKISELEGINSIVFLDRDKQVISEKNNSEGKTYTAELISILDIEGHSNEIGNAIFSKPFNVYTLLNENGVIIIATISSGGYLAVVAGEDTPVDLIALLRVVKEECSSWQKA